MSSRVCRLCILRPPGGQSDAGLPAGVPPGLHPGGVPARDQLCEWQVVWLQWAWLPHRAQLSSCFLTFLHSGHFKMNCTIWLLITYQILTCVSVIITRTCKTEVWAQAQLSAVLHWSSYVFFASCPAASSDVSLAQLNGLDGRDVVCRELSLCQTELNKNSPLLLELVRRGRHKHGGVRTSANKISEQS